MGFGWNGQGAKPNCTMLSLTAGSCQELPLLLESPIDGFFIRDGSFLELRLGARA
jgi:hypothetical protein